MTSYFHRTADLLEPIYNAQFASILESNVLAMDKTPIKAGRKKGCPPSRGRMRTGCFWPTYGDRDEVVIPFVPTRAHAVVHELLKGSSGTLVSDGYKAYDSYAKAMDNVVHAQCWTHSRRKFVEAETTEPRLAGEALDLIGALYEQERAARELNSPEKIRAHRREHSRPVVDTFFRAIAEAREKNILLPSNPYTKAVVYAELVTQEVHTTCSV